MVIRFMFDRGNIWYNYNKKNYASICSFVSKNHSIKSPGIEKYLGIYCFHLFKFHLFKFHLFKFHLFKFHLFNFYGRSSVTLLSALGMRNPGLEPGRLAPHEPESCASTNSASSASTTIYQYCRCLRICQVFFKERGNLASAKLEPDRVLLRGWASGVGKNARSVGFWVIWARRVFRRGLVHR
jgi:hypothetical protein